MPLIKLTPFRYIERDSIESISVYIMINNSILSNVYENFGVPAPESNEWNIDLTVGIVTDSGRYDTDCCLKVLSTSDRKMLADFAQSAISIQKSDEIKILTDKIVLDMIPKAMANTTVSLEEHLIEYVKVDPDGLCKSIGEMLDATYAELIQKQRAKKRL